MATYRFVPLTLPAGVDAWTLAGGTGLTFVSALQEPPPEKRAKPPSAIPVPGEATV